MFILINPLFVIFNNIVTLQVKLCLNVGSNELLQCHIVYLDKSSKSWSDKVLLCPRHCFSRTAASSLCFFIYQVSQWYELVVFTASMEIYGAAVADKLDNNRNILRRRYYRQVFISITDAQVPDYMLQNVIITQYSDRDESQNTFNILWLFYLFIYPFVIKKNILLEIH